MNLKRTLIRRLPPAAKEMLSVPYDRYQTWQANRQFARKSLPEYTPAADAPKHIILIVVDALRADYVNEELTPFLASLDGYNAITPGTWTFPAVSSILSGVYPHEHGAMRQSDTVDESDGITLPPQMDPDRETITEALAGAGYDTYGGFGHDTPFVALAGRFQDHDLFHTITSNADDVLNAYRSWVDGRDRTLGIVHLADPHIPVDPPAEYWDKHGVDRSIDGINNWRYNTTYPCDEACQRYRDHRRRLYRAAVEYVDDALRRFSGRIEAELDDYELIITADHGEALWEHLEFDREHFGGTGCVDHGGAPYESLARVPLLTTVNTVASESVSLVDIAPTIASLVGIDGPDMSGYSLIEDQPDNRLPLVEGGLNGYEKKAVYDDEYKLIVSHGDSVEVGYQLPEETVIELPAEQRERMLEALPPWPDGTSAETAVSEVVEDRLAQLGYK